MALTSARTPQAPDEVPKAALGVLLATGVAYVVAILVEAGNQPFTQNLDDSSSNTAFATITFGLAVLGFAIVAFHPGHRTGWLLLGFGLAVACGALAHAVAVRLLLVGDPVPWLGEPNAWFATWMFPAALGSLMFVPATWPTGRIEAPWLRRFAVVAAVALVVLVAGQSLAPDSLDGVAPSARIDNPLGVPGLGPPVNAATPVAVVVLVAFFLSSIIDLVVRSVRASGNGLVLGLGIAALGGFAVIGVASGPILGTGAWLVAMVCLSFAGLGVMAVMTTRTRRRSASAEEARAAMVAEREDDRRRLRADLHDGLGPLLAALGLTLDADEPASRDRARALVDEAIREVRRISRNLRPATLDDLGLVGALRHRAATLTESGGPVIEVTAQPEHLPHLPASVEVAAFRIASEAMTNAARHSGASLCHVRLDNTSHRGALQLEIVDNGTGVAPGGSGLGMSTMRARAEELGGQFHVGPGSSDGTRVVAVLPAGP
jgi:signal transduction histidine kinase